MGNKTDLLSELLCALTERKPAPVCFAPEEDYAAFLARRARTQAQLDAQRQTELYRMPRIAVGFFSETDGAKAARTRASLAAQTYSHWQEAKDAGEAYDFILFMGEGDTLTPDALFCFAEAINAEPEAELLYADEDVYLADGARADPVFKPEYSEITQLSYNMMGRPMLVSRALYVRAGGLRGADAAAEYDYSLRCAGKAGGVAHLPRVLLTRDARQKALPAAAAIAAIDAHLAAKGEQGMAATGLYAGSFRVRTVMQKGTRTALIVPNRNNVDALRRLLESIEEYAAFEKYELIIADGDSTDTRTQRYYEILERNRAARIVRSKRTTFPALANLGAEAARSDALLFLSRDAQVLTPDWLRALREQLARGGVGAVGGKLIDAKRSILFAGGVAGLGGWMGSPYAGEEDDTAETRKNAFINTLRAVSFLSGACMMVSVERFFNMGGFDETFADAGADLELCLRMGQRGLACVYTPFAALLLHGSLPTVEKAAEATKMRCYDALRPLLFAGDPYYSPNFDYASRVPIAAPEPKRALDINSYNER